MTTIRVILALASINNWELQQLDVSNAFFQGDFSEEVYMKIPQGLYGYESLQCCKLKKSLYGLKQASHKWYEKLSNLLLSYGYLQSHVDHSLFIKHEKGEFTSLLIYVDDIVLTGNSSTEITKLKCKTHKI